VTAAGTDWAVQLKRVTDYPAAAWDRPGAARQFNGRLPKQFRDDGGRQLLGR